MDINKLRYLVAGVVSAPRGERPKDWMALVASDRSPALELQLAALEQEIAAGRSGEPAARGSDRADRLAAVRKELERQGLDGFLVPRADEFQGEYVPPRAERLAWLTGFTGSAGLALVLAA
ncbi:MAG TPA: aminopeptidase P family N-terminal domain-containing protein, partial [Bradyrhizobium sp.]|nr:aminopeptidase P family N-terminal domain-containing protein [Bradyrhizobium sp.]